LLVGREDLEDEIEDNEIENGEEDVGIADCVEFLFNYADRCAVSVHFANLIINNAAIEIANTY
jgi:hypothetical protein